MDRRFRPPLAGPDDSLVPQLRRGISVMSTVMHPMLRRPPMEPAGREAARSPDYGRAGTHPVAKRQHRDASRRRRRVAHAVSRPSLPAEASGWRQFRALTVMTGSMPGMRRQTEEGKTPSGRMPSRTMSKMRPGAGSRNPPLLQICLSIHLQAKAGDIAYGLFETG